MIYGILIGTLASVVTLLLLHRTWNADLKQRLMYLVAGSTCLTCLAFFRGLLPHNSEAAVPLLQLLFLTAGVVHVILLMHYNLLGTGVSGSLLLGTTLTLAMAFLGACGVTLVSRTVLYVGDTFISLCVAPMLLPFFLYHAVSLWGAIPAAQIPDFLYHSGYTAPEIETGELVPVLFRIPRRYTGLRKRVENGSKISNEIFGSTFSQDLRVSDAFCKTVELVGSRKKSATIAQSARWRFYLKPHLFARRYLEPETTIGRLKRGTVINTERIEST